MLRRIAALLALCLAVAGMSLPGHAAATDCTSDGSNHAKNDEDPRVLRTETIPLAGGVAHTGFYAVPEGATSLVAMMHGYGNDASSWVCHIIEASEKGIAAFALDYPLQEPTRGWRVQEGATASIQIVEALLETHPSITTVVVFGVSMGGNAAGVMVADSKSKTKPTDAPLVDWWFNVEGVTNLRETYLEAKAVGHNAAPDIEQETGGPLQERPEAYSKLTVIDRIPDIVASGVKGVVSVHGVADGTVPFNQTREFHAALAAQAPTIPSEVYNVLRRGTGEAGTTGPSYVLGPAGQAEADPFAGHAWEGSDTHIVMRTALGRLWSLLGAEPSPVTADAEFLVDDETVTRLR